MVNLTRVEGEGRGVRREGTERRAERGEERVEEERLDGWAVGKRECQDRIGAYGRGGMGGVGSMGRGEDRRERWDLLPVDRFLY